MNLRTFIILALIGMFIYNVVEIKSNMIGKFAQHHAQIEYVMNQ